MTPTKPVADYTPCETCGHPRALHSARGCHVITENRATKRQPNVTCDCQTAEPGEVAEPTGESIATAIHDAVKKIHEDARIYRPPVLDPPTPPKPKAKDAKALLVEQQQRWVQEHVKEHK